MGTYSSAATPVGYFEVNVRTSCESGSYVDGGGDLTRSSSGIGSMGEVVIEKSEMGRDEDDEGATT